MTGEFEVQLGNPNFDRIGAKLLALLVMLTASSAPAAQPRDAAGRRNGSTAAAVPPTVTVKLVARNSPNLFGPDEITVDPVSDAVGFSAGTIFYVEVWAQTTHPTGLSSVSLDIGYNPAESVVNTTAASPFMGGIFHGLFLFTTLKNGTADNATGIVDDLSGSYLPATGCGSDSTGVAPGNWSRVAVVEMQAVASGFPKILASGSGSPLFGTAVCGMANSADTDITYIGINETTVVPQITVNLDIDALDALATPIRTVTFVMTECTGMTTEVRMVPVDFTTKPATVVLTNVSVIPMPSWISVQEGHTLRRRAPLTFTNFQAVVDMTSANGNPLISGDWQTATVAQDHIVDAVEFSILSSRWFQTIDRNLSTGADATGDGVQDTADFSVLVANFLKESDPSDGCVVASSGIGMLHPKTVGDGVSTRDARGTVSGVSAVDLAFAPQPRIVTRGSMFEVGLYATSTRPDGLDQSIAAIDAVLSWDPLLVELVGVVNNGPYGWIRSEFSDDSGLDGLNNTFLDGNARYTALAAFGSPAMATPDGLLVTTFRFTALREGSTADIMLESRLGSYSFTRVFGADAPNELVTGLLQNAGVAVVPPGECDGDGDIDMREFQHFQACFTGAVMMSNDGRPPAYSQAAADCCLPFDYDGDGDIEGSDFSFFTNLATGPRP